MAVEKMIMTNIIGRLEDVDSILDYVLNKTEISLVNAIDQIEDNRFVFKIVDENIDKSIDINDIKRFRLGPEVKENDEKVEFLENLLNEEPLYGPGKYDADEFDKMYSYLKELNDSIEKAEKRIAEISLIQENKGSLEDLDVNVEELRNLEYFTVHLGSLQREDRVKLKQNYDKILAIFLHLGTSGEREIYFSIYPKKVEQEMERILKSLHWNEIELPKPFNGTFKQLYEGLEDERSRLSGELKTNREKLNQYKHDNRQLINELVAGMNEHQIIEKAKDMLARSAKYFYLSGWTPVRSLDDLQTKIKEYDDALVLVQNAEQIEHMKVPTKLRNNRVVRPFETLVGMYGTPEYTELDPTFFFAISYMLLFGAMFGDVGQGAVFFLAGLALTKTKGKEYGSLLTRLGLSSMCFGVLYGSVFGNESLIPALWMKPFDNMNKVFIISVGFGIVLLMISYVLNIVNSIRKKQLEEGLFGKNGAAGFLIYLSIVAIVAQYYFKVSYVPMFVLAALIVIALVLMVVKQPLTNMILGKKKLYDEDKGSYYIEGSFSLLEAMLSIVTAIVSFIRVGAFAINHVGLFLAFKTIGKIIGTSFGQILMAILGNILIVGLEGMVVFIQGLRLEYYELFSRYYDGGGVKFEPTKLSLRRK